MPRGRKNPNGFIGVEKRGKSYRAKVYTGRRIITGHAKPTAEEAARDYDRIARDRLGRHANQNFPDGEPE